MGVRHRKGQKSYDHYYSRMENSLKCHFWEVPTSFSIGEIL